MDTCIWPDRALVINPAHLGISATGRELEKLFVDFCNRHGGSAWQFELSPGEQFIVMPPVHHPGDREGRRKDVFEAGVVGG